jgi:DNA-binding transcriptional LysR family regulator
MLSDLWPGLDLRHLAAFSAVAKTRSFARAAAVLGYTQPAVSQQIRALENIVGQRLFDRSSGRAEATLTEAGAVLAAHVDDLTARLSLARQDLEDLARGEAGTIRVGAFQSALARILPHVLKRYRAERPGVRVEPVESNADVPLLAEVADGRLDFAFVLLPVDTRTLAYRELVRDEFLLVSKAGANIGRVRSVDDLTSHALILHRTCRSAAAVIAHLEAQVGAANIVFRSDDNAAIKEMVRAGLGVALLPELWAQLGGNEGLELTPLSGVIPPRTIVLAWRKDRLLTPGQEAFVDVATTVVAPPRLERVAG